VRYFCLKILKLCTLSSPCLKFHLWAVQTRWSKECSQLTAVTVLHSNSYQCKVNKIISLGNKSRFSALLVSNRLTCYEGLHPHPTPPPGECTKSTRICLCGYVFLWTSLVTSNQKFQPLYTDEDHCLWSMIILTSEVMLSALESLHTSITWCPAGHKAVLLLHATVKHMPL
jgi:hypothetical protein